VFIAFVMRAAIAALAVAFGCVPNVVADEASIVTGE
jgi:hypothetical protein